MIAIVLSLLWLIAILVPVGGLLLTLRYATVSKGKKAQDPSADLPGITVLKPLCGIDPGLEQNLRSFFELDYPAFELIFSVARAEDGATAVAQKLIAEFPNVDARLIIGQSVIGPNPKINNMIQGYESARYEHILISDSNMRAHRSYLQELAAELLPQTTIETSIIVGAEESGLGGALESLYMNTWFARGMVVAKTIGHPCVMGKSMFFKKKAFEELGGMRELALHLAEDFVSGERCLKMKKTVTLNRHPVVQYIGKRSFKEFWNRHVRWGRMRKILAPHVFITEPCLTVIGSAAAGAYGLNHLFGISPLRFVAAHLLVWMLADLAVIKKLGGRVSLLSPLTWLLGQLLHIPFWFTIAYGRTVQWRGNSLYMNRDGTIRQPHQLPLIKKWYNNIPNQPQALVRRISFAVLAAVLAVAAVEGFSLRHLNTKYSLREFMPANHPLYLADNEIRKAFSLSDELPMLVTLELTQGAQGTWLTPERVQALKDVTDSVSRVDGIKHVTSVSNFESAVSSAKGIEVGNALSMIPSDQWTDKIMSSKLLVPALISKDGRSAMIICDIGVPSTEQIASMVAQVRSILSARFPEGSQVRPMVGGVVPLQSDMTFLVGKELQRFLVLGLIACVLTLMAYFRSFSTVLGCLLLAALSNIGALSWMAISGVPFSILSTCLPVLASITALAIGSHTFLNFGNAWDAEVRNETAPNKLKVVRDIYRSLALPNFLMVLTTSIGFATLCGSEVPLMRQFALSISIGIVMGWLSVTFALPALMVLLPIPKARRWTSSNAQWAHFVMKFRQLLFVAVVIGSVAIGVHGTKLNWSVRLFDDLPDAGSIKASATLIDQSLGGMIPLEVMIRIKSESNPWNEPARIAKLNGLLDRWRANPAVGSALGLPEYLQAGSAFQQNVSRQSIAETLFLLSMSEGNPVSHILTSDGEATRLAFRLKDVPAAEMEKLVQALVDDSKKTFPESEITVGGMGSMVHTLNAELSKELISGLWQSLFWISILMILIFRSVKWAVVAAVPNLLAPLVLLATMALLNTPIKPTVAVIFSIALGVAYNNTVYLMSRLKALQGQYADPIACVRETWYQEGNPCLFSSLAVFGGFAVFLSSYFALNRTFGAYMLWSIGVGLFGDLIFLPALLGVFPKLVAADELFTLFKRKPQTVMKATLTVGTILIALFASIHGWSAPAESADDLLKAVEKNMHSKDESATIKMIIIEANGSKKERDLKISRMDEKDGQSVMVRLMSPPDLRGTSLLSTTHGSQADQWLYFPSSKQTRRILSGKRSSNFLDSELSYEDLGSAVGSKVTNKVLRKDSSPDGEVAVIETSLNNPDSAYSRVLSWIPVKSHLITKVEYYDRAGTLLKTTEMQDYKRFGSVWRAQKVLVKNNQNQRATELDLKDLKVDQGLSASAFSPSALGNQ